MPIIIVMMGIPGSGKTTARKAVLMASLSPLMLVMSPNVQDGRGCSGIDHKPFEG